MEFALPPTSKPSAGLNDPQAQDPLRLGRSPALLFDVLALIVPNAPIDGRRLSVPIAEDRSKRWDEMNRPQDDQTSEKPRNAAEPDDAWDVYGVDHYLDLPQDVQDTWGLFLKAYKVVIETVDRQTVQNGPISLAEFELMLYVEWAGGRIRFNTLSKVTLLSAAQISRRVSSLQDKGFLLRISTDQDRRATYAVMTDAGRHAFAEAQAPFLAALRTNFLKRVPPEKMTVFREVLASLVNDPVFPENELKLITERSPEPKSARDIGRKSRS